MHTTLIRNQFRTMLATEVAPNFADKDVPAMREALDAMGAAAEMPAGMTVERGSLAGVPLEHLTPRARERRVLLHAHGGGFSMGSCQSHRTLVGQLGVAARARVVLPEYRLAPEHPCPAGIDDMFAVYRALLVAGTPAEQVIVSGDSAGGGLVISMLLKARDAGLPMPRAVVLLSPHLDLTCSGESMRTRADADPWLTRELCEDARNKYLGDADPATYPYAPFNTPLAGLPPILIQVGDQEILLSDSEGFAQRAQAAGVPVTLEVYPELWHVFQFFAPMLPDAVDAIARIGAYVDQCFNAQRLRRVG
jgi:monoterpene epsilon-lactone hydrolase